MNELQILRTQELADLLGVSKQTVWRLSKSGELPPKVKISGRAVGWTWGSIRDFVEERKQEPETEAA
jgi:excisionase family DNA binding protein